MIDSVRTRLTLWHVSVLAAALLMIGGLIYVLLARALYVRIDDNLRTVVEIAMTSLANDLAEGQDTADAARSTAAELSSSQQMLAIYDEAGMLLAEDGRDDDLQITLPALDTIPTDSVLLLTFIEPKDTDDRHRLALRRVTIPPGARYLIVVGSSLEPTDEELEFLREILAYIVPLSLVFAGIGGWFLARKSFAPVVAMAERARKIGVEHLGERLPVANPRDELGQLAETFNELLGRLEASLIQQRQFMADASHEMRTPVATARTAASVALQQPDRTQVEYREALSIIEQQTARLSRVVDDMFTLARADAGNYPVRATPMYLDEVVDDVVRASRLLASFSDVTIEIAPAEPAPFTGDEDLIRRMVGNLLDNAVSHTPADKRVTVELQHADGRYVILITDQGTGIPIEVQSRIFERFYRADTARTRRRDGAGLGLALARWIAHVHGGDVVLARSSDAGSTFSITLPAGRGGA
jgi:two-component system OmpR family sensor kinase